jgi:SagB-type dehydrogenase family enzyme
MKTAVPVLRIIELPDPVFRAGRSLGRALQRRRTIREISDRKLSLQAVANLLWAACGVNRRHGPFGLPGRTAPSASNSQEIEVYAAMAEGAYRYDPFHHRLLPYVAADLRRLAIGPRQSRSGDRAPIRLIYVVDIDRLVHTQGYQEPGLQDPETQRAYYYVDTGVIAANVYLHAASVGLAAWFHNCDRAALAAALRLRDSQRALFGQTVGYALKGAAPGRGARRVPRRRPARTP